MSSNLPPGCSEYDIPGNRPEDLELEAAEELLLDACGKESLSADEYAIVAEVGLAAVKKFREIFIKAREDWEADQQQYLDWLKEETKKEIQAYKEEFHGKP